MPDLKVKRAPQTDVKNISYAKSQIEYFKNMKEFFSVQTTQQPAQQPANQPAQQPANQKTPANSFEMLLLSNGNHILTGVKVSNSNKLKPTYKMMKGLVTISKWKNDWYCFVNSTTNMKKVIKIVEKVSGFKYIGERDYKK